MSDDDYEMDYTGMSDNTLAVVICNNDQLYEDSGIAKNEQDCRELLKDFKYTEKQFEVFVGWCFQNRRKL